MLSRVSILTPGVTPFVTGGMQRHSLNMARELSKMGVLVDLYHTDLGSGRSIERLVGMTADEQKNITSLPISWQTDKLPGHYIRSLKKFSREALSLSLKRDPVDFVIAKSLTAWSFLHERPDGVTFPPIGVNFHGYEMFQPRPDIRTKLEAAMLRHPFLVTARAADYVFSYGGKITNIVRDKMKIPSAKIIEIPGGVDPGIRVTHPSPLQRRRRFVFLGRYERRKGIEELNQAILNSPEWDASAEFKFIGPIPKVKRLSLSNVEYLGELADPMAIQSELQCSDILLCPSHSEGMPNVIMEGMAAGLAVLATNVGAVKMLVSAENGLLLQRSTVETVGSGIDHLIKISEAELSDMKSKSHEKISNFFWPRIAKKTRRLLEQRIIADLPKFSRAISQRT